MGAISTIRKHYAIVVGLIGVAIAAFILTDILSPEGGTIFTPDDTVGNIAGHEVSYNHFEERLRQGRERFISQTGNPRLNPTQQAQLENQVWNQLVREIILSEEYSKLNLSITDQEMMDMFDPQNPHRLVRELLADPQTGQFDPQMLQQFIAAAQQEPQFRGQLVQIENMIEQEQLQNKYMTLIQNSLYTTDLEARDAFYNANKHANISFFGISLNTIPDDAISMSNRDIRQHYNQTRKKYEQEAGRDVRFINFEVKPSVTDSNSILAGIKEIIEPFKRSANDSMFVELNSDRPEEDHFPSFRRITNVNFEVRDSLVNASPGDIIGPYITDGKYALTKLIDVEEDSIYSFRSRQIILEEDDDNEQLARELLNRIRAGESFDELAREYSIDPSAEEGGDMGWVNEGDFIDPIENALIDMNQGDLRIVNTEFGIHILQLIQPKVRELFNIATVTHIIRPSTETYNVAFDKAYDFVLNVNDPESFEALAEEMGMRTRSSTGMRINDQFVTGLGAARRIVRWAFENKQGAVSDVFEVGDNYVVAYVEKARSKGFAPLDEVRNEVKEDLLNKRKREEIARLIRESVTDGITLNELAAEFNAEVQSASRLTFNDNSLPQIGRDPRLIGSVFGLQPGLLSTPMKGDQFVIVSQVNSFADVTLPDDLRRDKQNITQRRQRFASDYALEFLTGAFEVNDERYRFY